MGLPGGDHRLPPAGLDAVDRARDARRTEPRGWIDRRSADARASGSTRGMLRATLVHARAALDHWPRFAPADLVHGRGRVRADLAAAADGAGRRRRRAGVSGIEAMPAFLDAGDRDVWKVRADAARLVASARGANARRRADS